MLVSKQHGQVQTPHLMAKLFHRKDLSGVPPQYSPQAAELFNYNKPSY